MDKINLGNFNHRIENGSLKWKLLGFTKLPNCLFYDKNLGISCLIVYWCLRLHQFQNKDNCRLSIPTIMKECRLSKPTVLKALEDLQKKPYLTIEKRKGLTSKYFLLVK